MNYKFNFLHNSTYRKCICFKRYRWYNNRVALTSIGEITMEGGEHLWTFYS